MKIVNWTLPLLGIWMACSSPDPSTQVKPKIEPTLNLGARNEMSTLNTFYTSCIDSAYKKNTNTVYLFRSKYSCVSCFRKGETILDSFIKTLNTAPFPILNITLNGEKTPSFSSIQNINTDCSIDQYNLYFEDFNLFYLTKSDSFILRTYSLEELDNFRSSLNQIHQELYNDFPKY